jgi:hypothetical protein
MRNYNQKHITTGTTMSTTRERSRRDTIRCMEEFQDPGREGARSQERGKRCKRAIYVIFLNMLCVLITVGSLAKYTSNPAMVTCNEVWRVFGYSSHTLYHCKRYM